MVRLSLVGFLFAAGCQEYRLQGENDPANLPDNDGDVPNGPAPDIAVTPASLDFGARPAGCEAEPQTITVKNEGDAPLTVDELKLIGDGKVAYTLSAGPLTLAPGERQSFDIGFTPPTLTTFDAKLRVLSDDPDEDRVDVPLAGEGAADALYEEFFLQSTPSAVDVLWVVDNSCSMSEEVERLQDSFEAFMDQFVRLGLDWQLGVVSTDVYAADQSGRLLGSPNVITTSTPDPIGTFVKTTTLGTSGSGDEQGLQAARLALTEPLLSGANAGFLRTDANLAVVVLSDENDYSADGASSYISFLNKVKGDPDKSSLSALVGDRSSGLFDPGGCMATWTTGVEAEGGDKYIDVADATGGAFASICELDFDAVLTYLSFTAAGLHTKFVLTEVPSNLGKVEVTLEGTKIPYTPANGWTWISAENAIEMHGDAVPGPGEALDVRYPIRTSCD